MTTLNLNIRPIIVLAMMLLAAFTRLIPHPANFTAIMAVALFGGAKLKNPFVAIVAPLSVMLITDLVIGFHSLMPLVYTCIALSALIGIYAVGEKSNTLGVISGSILSSTLFFLVTNFGVWFHNPEYPQNVEGLMACYIVAIPFYGNQLFGDLFFNAILFGSFALFSKKVFIFSR